MEKIIAVVGCGHWGKNLVRNFSELGVLGAICDPNEQLAKSFAREYDVDVCSFDEILASKSIKGVVLAVPAPLHADMAIRAMDAQKHVYVEKPLAMNRSEAQQMLFAAEENSVQLMVGHLLQYHPAFITLRALVESGRLGELNYIYSNRLSFGKIRSEEDVIWSFAPHDISMILSLAGAAPEIVATKSTDLVQKGISDTATIHLEFPNKLCSHVSVSWLHPYKEQKLIVIGRDAMLVFDDTKEWSEKLAMYKHRYNVSDGVPNLQAAGVEYIDVGRSEPLKKECLHFVDVVHANRKPLTDGVEGLEVLRVLEAASLSQLKDEPIRLSSYE